VKKAVLLSPLSLFPGICAVFVIWWLRDPSIAEENALIENIQAGFLLLALFFTVRRFRSERGWNSVLIFFFLTFLTILLREIDLRPFPLPRSVVLLSSKGRNLALAIGWSVFLYFFIRHYRAAIKEFVILLRKVSGKYILLGCLFYGFAWPFDEGMFEITKNTTQFIEELMEVMGTLAFVFAAFFLYKKEGRLHAVREKLPNDACIPKPVLRVEQEGTGPEMVRER
jgi:hypothetical protein